MMIVPIFFMMAVTFTALIMKIVQLSKALAAGAGANVFGNGLQLVLAVLVLVLGVCVAVQGISSLFGREKVGKEA
ncbi:hypothetical protein SDC9_133343 [bioreactor metagenome]|uniref:Uncharacterized protein n=1 Tax=bioreactor metagenome TaxID=1076179 RepID=A0A645DA80_9ZZZZ